MADFQVSSGGTYSHFGHVSAAAQYQQVSQQRQAGSHHHSGIGGGSGLSVGIRGRDRPARNSGGGSREHGGGHQRRPSRDSDAGSSASEQTTMQHQQQPPQQSPSSGGLPNGGDANSMGLTSPSGSAGTPKGTQRPPPPPGFGATTQAGGLVRQPAATNNGPVAPQQQQSLASVMRPGLAALAPPGSAPKPGVGANPAGASSGAGQPPNGIDPNHQIGSGSSSGAASSQQQQGPAGPTPAATGGGVAVMAGAPSRAAAIASSGTSVGPSTQLNPAAPPFRSLHGGSLEQVEGNLLAQADAGGLKDKVTKFHALVRQRDALDACILSELSGLVTEAERQAAARDAQRQQAAALEETRARMETLTSQLADRDGQLATARRQIDDKDTALRTRDTQIRKLESELAEARRRSSTMERDLTAATQRADSTASKLSAVEQELGALREAYKAQSESHAMEQHQQHAAAAAVHHHHQQQQQQQAVGDNWHHAKAPNIMGPMGQPLHQLGGGGAPPEGSGAPGGPPPGPPFGVIGLASLAGPPGPGQPGGASAAGGAMKGAAAAPPGPGTFQMPPPLHPLFNPPPVAPGAMDAATAVQMAGFMEAANAAVGGAGLFGDRFLPPPPPGMPLPPGFHLPPHPPPLHPHPMAPFGAPPVPPEEIQAKILDLLPSDPAEALQWDERMDAALDAALAPLQWVRDLAHVYGNPRGFMMTHPELFAQRQDGAFYRSPRAGSTGGAGAGAAGGGVAGRLMSMLPPPPGMGPPVPPHAAFVMPGLAATGLMFGNTHY